MSPEQERPQQGPDDPDPTPPQHPEPHDETGLDLARAIARATAGMQLPTGSGRRGRRSGPGKRTSGGRGGRAAHSGAHPDERDPQPLDSTVGRLVSDHGWAVDLRVHGVFGRWAELVGDEVAQHTTPESFEEGRLVVRTDSTAWATQLKLLAPTIVRRLNTELGHGTVTLIEVLGPHGPTWKKGRLGTRDGRGPRDTYG